MPLELSGDGVRQGADSLEARLVVREHGEVGIEELVGLADGHLERQPVAGGRDGLRSETVLSEPGVDGVDRLGARSDELLNLQMLVSKLRKATWEASCTSSLERCWP